MSSLIVWIPGITSLFCSVLHCSALFCSVLSVKSYYIIVSYPNHVLELITGAIIIIINDVGIPSTFPDILPPARQNLSDQLLLLYAKICFVSCSPCSSRRFTEGWYWRSSFGESHKFITYPIYASNHNHNYGILNSPNYG